ncbi:MAG TPA: pyridoxal phosphate-dependent aminotransferase [Bryobacteraceae bacterium]|nr:pyridoxal phosphate-dependent aminotransferase [Bryobacteraceae bacterium]
MTKDTAKHRLNSRMSQLQVESAFEVLVRARALEKQGRSVIHLEIGEPDFPTPPHIIEAGKRAMDEGYTKYGPTAGLPELRESIARYISRTRGLTVNPDGVCVVPGAKPIMFFTMLALIEPGDEVIYPDPGFPIYESMIRYTGAVPVPIPLVENRGFSFDLDIFRSKLSDKTRMVILNSPENPTGGTIPPEDMAQIASMLRDRDVMVLSDEIYTRLCYDTEPVSIATFEGMQEKTIILDGFSKTYSMTGWRLGYGVMPLWLAEAVNTLMVNSNSCTATFTQRAGIAALEGPQDCVEQMAAEFRRRRDAFCAGLNTIPGFRCPLPGGAFYAFVNVQGTGIASKELSDYLLSEAGVACLNGGAFGAQGDGYIRFSYANSLPNLLEAVERIQKVSTRWAKK